MDQNGRRASSKNVDSSDKSSAGNGIAEATIPTTIVTSDPMIIPTSPAIVNGEASPSPSKRMRFELFISTPVDDDRGSSKNLPIPPPPKCLVDAKSAGFFAKEIYADADEDGKAEVEKPSSDDADNDDDSRAKRKTGVARLGFRRLYDDVDGEKDERKISPHDSLPGEDEAEPTPVAPLRIVAVLPERYNRPVSTVEVLVARVFDRTKSAIFLQAICQVFRLPENLNHLKRYEG